MKKKNIPQFVPTPTTEITISLDKNSETQIVVNEKKNDHTIKYDEQLMDKETMDIIFNDETKTFDRIYIKYSLTGNMEIVRIEKGHTNPLVMQQEISKYFLEKLVTKRKK